MSLAVRGFNPIWFEVDLTAHPFDDTFYMFTLQNTIPYQPQTVWHDQNMNVPYTGAIRFLANGTLPVDIFFDPKLVYRLEFRQGPTQNDPLIYEVDNYQATGSGSAPPPSAISFNTDNQITNPQFSLVNFITPYTLNGATNPDPLEVAPGWFLYLTGTGNVTLTQVPLNSTTPNPTNAPYALEINVSGIWTNVQLKQRFQQNGLLWANKIVSSSITARITGPSQEITAFLFDSNGNQIAQVLNPVPVTSTFQEYKDIGALTASSDTDLPPVAYIEYVLQLQNNMNIFVTSFQLSVQDLPVTLAYLQDSIDRQIDYTFHYYKPKLEYKPIPSFLVGWDFPLNPAQLYGRTVAASTIGNIGNNTAYYAYDQTIIFQTVSEGVNISPNTSGNNAITLSAALDGQCAILQYLGNPMATDILVNRISSMINSAGTNGTKLSITLWYSTNSTLPKLPNTFFSGLDANGVPTGVISGWAIVPRDFGDAHFNTTAAFSDQSFHGWNLNNFMTATSAKFFAIVVGTSAMLASQAIAFKSISLNAGDIPTNPAPQAPDEVLRECQFYYEVTGDYAEEMLVNPSPYLTGAQTLSLVSRIFNVDYEIKRVPPVLTMQSPISGSPNLVNGVLFNSGSVVKNQDIAIGNATDGWTNWTPTVLTVNNAVFEPLNVNGLISMGVGSALWPEAYITYIAIADARLGVV